MTLKQTCEEQTIKHKQTQTKRNKESHSCRCGLSRTRAVLFSRHPVKLPHCVSHQCHYMITQERHSAHVKVFVFRRRPS